MGAGWTRWWQDTSRYHREIEELDHELRIRNEDPIEITFKYPGWNARISFDEDEDPEDS